MSVKAFLLCAGLGGRFQPHTDTLPKVLLPFLNLPLVSYNLSLLKTLEVKQYIANIHKHSELIAQSLRKSSKMLGQLSPAFSYESQLLGSAGGLRQVQSFLENEEHFYYLNGDTLIWPHREESLSSFYDSHVKSKALVSFLCTPSDKLQEVIWSNSDSQVTSFLKPVDPRNKSFHFCGLALFSKEIFQFIKPGDRHIFKDVLEKLCLKTELRVHSVKDLEVLDMNQLTTYLEGHRLALQSLFKKPLMSQFLRKTLDTLSPGWSRFQEDNYVSGTRVLSPPEKKDDYLFCGQGVKGLNNVEVTGFAVLGNHCQVKSPCQVLQSVVSDKALLDHSINKKLFL